MIAHILFVTAWALAMAGTRAAEEQRAANAIWLNSTHLLGSLDPKVTNLERSWFDESPFAPRGTVILDALQDVGKTPQQMFADPRRVAAAVLGSLPPMVCVIPTEQYFYFEMFFDGEWIAGNLRCTDAAQGILHCGYYLRRNPDVSGYAALGASDGLCVSESAVGEHRVVHVSDEETGAETDFVVVVPSKLTFCEHVQLAESETVVTPIIDESGTCFALTYNRASKEFYYILIAPVPTEELAPASASQCSIGSISGFMYMRDSMDRHILVGVRKDDIRDNSFFDGPFDQVPPDLDLRGMILDAYPGIEAHNGDSLDVHGNWVSSRNTRVAIAPYATYDDSTLDVAVRLASQRALRRSAFEDRLAMKSFFPEDDSAARAAREAWSAVVWAHAKEWPANHDLGRSAASVQAIAPK